MTPSPQLSVVIPTRDRLDLLLDVLGSLGRLDDDAPFEVVVVDDGSTPPLADRLPGSLGSAAVRVLRQEGRGLNVARNAGAADASAPLIAFLDDDVLVGPNWAQAMVRAFDDPRVGGVGGRIVLRFEGACPTWFDTEKFGAYLSQFDFGPDPMVLDGVAVPFGANCAVRHEAFDAVGGFAMGLDRVGTSLLSGGDTEFFHRVREAGFTLLYAADAALEHRIGSDRVTSEYLLKRAYGQGCTDAYLSADRRGGGRERLDQARTLGLATVKAWLPGQERSRFERRRWLAYVRGWRSAGASVRVEP